jgi:hypothetical protein
VDIYPSQSDLENKTNQLHDFNPGFGDPVNANGDRTFWTTAIPICSVNVDFQAGKAEMRVSHLDIEDYFNLPNSLKDGQSIPATVAFDVVWGGDVTRRLDVRDPAHGFEGRFKEQPATVVFAAKEDGFTFVSNPANTTRNLFAEIGRERNGSLFV